MISTLYTSCSALNVNKNFWNVIQSQFLYKGLKSNKNPIKNEKKQACTVLRETLQKINIKVSLT